MSLKYFEYIFIFVPLAVLIYFVLNSRGFTKAGRLWLLLGSLLFYVYLSPLYLPILLISILVNFFLGNVVRPDSRPIPHFSRKTVISLGILFNVGLLGYFKYSNFLIDNINFFFSTGIDPIKILAPVGISYFTLVQIAFLVDSYRGKLGTNDFIPYALFVSFFPKIIQGPIALQGEMASQFTDAGRSRFNSENFARGILFIAIGLFKKLVLADNLGVWATQGYDHAAVLPLIEAWLTMLAYCFQLYFDFSGYTDMAMGIGLMFNIRIPDNFDSPYKSLNYQELWRRWHITLGRFLREYIYIPLGGNRKGEIRTYVNLLITFIIGGLWHGAAWTYVFWGAMNGLGLMVHRIWRKTGFRMNRGLAWLLTFIYWNITVIMWRAVDYKAAVKIYRGVIGLDGVVLPSMFENEFMKSAGVTFGPWLANLGEKEYYYIYLIIACSILCFFTKNSMEMAEKLKPNMRWALFVSLVLGISIIHITQISQFIYANF